MIAEPRRTKIVADRQTACEACPWRIANRGRRTSGGWYTLANLRRLWNGLRSGAAPGMTCHQTDPVNPPSDDGRRAPAGTETKECAGALLLVAREIAVLNRLANTHGVRGLDEYRRRRPKGLTKHGIIAWATRSTFGGTPFGGIKLPASIANDEAIQHPDFEAPAAAGQDGE